MGVFAQEYNSSGVAQGNELQVNITTAGDQQGRAVAMDADGDLAVAWHGWGQDGGSWGVFAQRFQGEDHVSGDFDSDGGADILWRNAVTDDNVLWRMDGFERLETGSIGAAYTQWRVAGIADFTGDYRADVLWRNADTNNIALWQMNGFDKMAAGAIGPIPMLG